VAKLAMEQVALTVEMVSVMAVLAFTVYLFAFEIVRVDVAAIIVMVILGLGGFVPPDRLFDGFSSNAVISIIAVMILGAGLDRTGVMSRLAAYILRVGGSTEKRIIPIVSGVVGVISGFMQNIGAAALFLPVVSRISTRTGIPLSRLVMPMGFCAILGGTLTLIGSSPLILLNDLIETSNRSLPSGVSPMETFSLFSVTPVGLALVTAGIAYFVVAGPFVLPKKDISADPEATSRYFEDIYGIRGEIFDAKVTLHSPIVGVTVGELEEKNGSVCIVGIRNADELTVAPPREEMIWVGSILALMGTPADVKEFTHENLLARERISQSFVDVLNPSRAGVSEAVVPPGSSVIGRTIGDIRMRKRYGASVIALHRAGETIRDQLRSIELRAGDTLALHSAWEDLLQLSKSSDFAVVTDFPRETTRPKNVVHALVFFLLTLFLILFTDTRLSLALFFGAIGMIATGVLSIEEAYKSVGWQSVFLLASLIPLGVAVESSGTAAWIAQKTLEVIGEVPDWVLQTVVAVLATLFTLVMSNVGATVLLVPLAVNIAVNVGADPALYALIVALATSNSFVLPTHQVNALTMGAGGYSTAEFIRAGGIMTILFLVVMLAVVNLVF
jgi:di/tricarboxylate transporter